MHSIKRAMRHLFTTTATGRRAFPADSLKAIQKAIAKGESTHRAEVRLIVEPALGFRDAWSGMTSRQRARGLFAHYEIWDTEENCGILIYLNLADHKVEIISDRGVGRMIDAEQWRAVCHTMTKGFSQGEFHDSTIAGIEQLNGMLTAVLPDQGAAPNQLSNRPILL
ncbi:TPM domain-containing protein [soil metagenome]